MESSSETVRGVAAVAMEFPISDEAAPSSFSTPVRVPTRIRKRLSAECKTPSTVEEIEAKLRHADLRRQAVYDCPYFGAVLKTLLLNFFVYINMHSSSLSLFKALHLESHSQYFSNNSCCLGIARPTAFQ
ncbi:hypothetical protein ACOSP7_004310 [Xanthoceras sorbifolium]